MKRPYPDLFDLRPVKPEVEAVVGQAPNFGVVSVVAHAHNRDPRGLDQLKFMTDILLTLFSEYFLTKAKAVISAEPIECDYS